MFTIPKALICPPLPGSLKHTADRKLEPHQSKAASQYSPPADLFPKVNTNHKKVSVSVFLQLSHNLLTPFLAFSPTAKSGPRLIPRNAFIPAKKAVSPRRSSPLGTFAGLKRICKRLAASALVVRVHGFAKKKKKKENKVRD